MKLLRFIYNLLGQLIWSLLVVAAILGILWTLGRLQEATSDRKLEGPPKKAESHLIEI